MNWKLETGNWKLEISGLLLSLCHNVEVECVMYLSAFGRGHFLLSVFSIPENFFELATRNVEPPLLNQSFQTNVCFNLLQKKYNENFSKIFINYNLVMRFGRFHSLES